MNTSRASTDLYRDQDETEWPRKFEFLDVFGK